jgi:hypothetical protein
MNERQLSAARLRARLDAIEQPHLEKIDGLRELLELQDPLGRRKTWSDVLDENTYREWLSLSDLYEQTEWGMS